MYMAGARAPNRAARGLEGASPTLEPIRHTILATSKPTALWDKAAANSLNHIDEIQMNKEWGIQPEINLPKLLVRYTISGRTLLHSGPCLRNIHVKKRA